MNDDSIITCSRCGSEMKASSRYCIKCGNLNPNHPDNNKYSKLIKKTNNNTNYQLGSGKKIYNNNTDKSGMNFISERNANRKVFIGFNIIVIAVLCIISFLPLLSLETYSIKSILYSGVLTNLFYVGIFSLLFVSTQILFIKINEYWWSSLIPIYNYYLLSKAVFNNNWMFLLMFVPIVNIVYFIVLYYKLGIAFGKNGVLTVLLFPIMIPIIAFGSSAFNRIYYVTDYSHTALEKTYGSYKKFADFSVFLVLIGLIGIIFTGNFFSLINNNKDEVFMVAGGEGAYKRVKSAIARGRVVCYDEFNNKTSIIYNGEYYFYSEDFLFEYGFKSNLIDGSKGYVKVVNNDGIYTYYISYATEKLGVKEVNVKELSVDKVEENVFITPPEGIMCSID